MPVKCKVETLQNFVAFSEYMNFTKKRNKCITKYKHKKVFLFVWVFASFLFINFYQNLRGQFKVNVVEIMLWRFNKSLHCNLLLGSDSCVHGFKLIMFWFSVWYVCYSDYWVHVRLIIMRSLFISAITRHDIQQLSINLLEFTQFVQLMNWQNNSCKFV